MDFNVLTHPFYQRKLLNIPDAYTSILKSLKKKFKRINQIEENFQLVKFAQPVSAATLKQSVIPGS